MRRQKVVWHDPPNIRHGHRPPDRSPGSYCCEPVSQSAGQGRGQQKPHHVPVLRRKPVAVVDLDQSRGLRSTPGRRFPRRFSTAASCGTATRSWRSRPGTVAEDAALVPIATGKPAACWRRLPHSWYTLVIYENPLPAGRRARAAGGSLIVLCAHNGDELLATFDCAGRPAKVARATRLPTASCHR